MIFIVGLGNPGKNYAQTRHNVGFLWLEYFREYLNQKGGKTWPAFLLEPKWKAEVSKQSGCVLLKPQTFMNLSGQAVQSVMQFFDKDSVPKSQSQALQNVLVCHDDLDLELGKMKVQFGTGPKVHNGLASVYQYLKTDQFWHIRIGVDSRGGDRTISGAEYVLMPFSAAEQETLKSVFETTAKHVFDNITPQLGG